MYFFPYKRLKIRKKSLNNILRICVCVCGKTDNIICSGKKCQVDKKADGVILTTVNTDFLQNSGKGS